MSTKKCSTFDFHPKVSNGEVRIFQMNIFFQIK